MRYETIKDLKTAEFKRLTGVKPETFEAMLSWVTEKTRLFGRPSKLTLADQLLLTLLYWREYRTLFHLGRDFDVSEATACRTVRRIESLLIQSEQFQLPGKKVLKEDGLLGKDTEYEVAEYQVVVVDATECPVERPKKNSAATTPARRSDIPRRPNS